MLLWIIVTLWVSNKSTVFSYLARVEATAAPSCDQSISHTAMYVYDTFTNSSFHH